MKRRRQQQEPVDLFSISRSVSVSSLALHTCPFVAAVDAGENVERKRAIRCNLEIDDEVNRSLQTRRYDVVGVGSHSGRVRQR